MNNEDIEICSEILIEENQQQLECCVRPLNVEKPESHNPAENDYREKRTALRFAQAGIEIWVRVNGFLKSKRFIQGQLLNISATGTKCLLEKKIGIGRSICLKFVFRDSTEFLIDAKIVRRENKRKYLYSIEFNERNILLSEKLIDVELHPKESSATQNRVLQSP